MPTIEHDKLVRDYYEEVKHKYPLFTLAQFTWICKAPFEWIKKCIRKDNLPFVCIKYLGKIKVYPGKIRQIKKTIDNRLHLKMGTDEEIEIDKARSQFLEEYLQKVLSYESHYKKFPQEEYEDED